MTEVAARMRVSVAIITREETERVSELAGLIAALVDPKPDEVVVAAEDAAVDQPQRPAARVEGYVSVRIPKGRGIAYNRNRALEICTGDVIVFIDDDCTPCAGWLGELLAPLGDPSVAAVMGDVRIARSTVLGDSISALGFPAGGSMGFASMFNVDEQGFTDHLSTLNCAVRRGVFDEVGAFDETMTYGSEDTELSHRMVVAGLAIRFRPTALVEHDARATIEGFARWFFRRGRSAHQLGRRMPAGPVIALRLGSYRRILARHARDPKLALIVPLLVASVVLQETGFVWQAITRRREP